MSPSLLPLPSTSSLAATRAVELQKLLFFVRADFAYKRAKKFSTHRPTFFVCFLLPLASSFIIDCLIFVVVCFHLPALIAQHRHSPVDLHTGDRRISLLIPSRSRRSQLLDRLRSWRRAKRIVSPRRLHRSNLVSALARLPPSHRCLKKAAGRRHAATHSQSCAKHTQK